MLTAVLESTGVTSGQEGTMHELAWTSSGFRTQECVRAWGPWALISLHHLRMKEGSEKWFSLHPGLASGLCCCLICLLPSSCFPTLPTIVIPLCWGDTQASFCSAKCLVQPGKWGTFNENQPARTAPGSLFLPAHLPGTRRVTVGVWTGPQKPSAEDKDALTSGGQWAARDWGGCWGRESCSFTTWGWWGCEQGPSSAPSRQLARSAVFAGSVKRTHFMGDIYHYPVLLKYSLCSRLELVRLLSSQVGGWWINLWVLQPWVNYRKSSPMSKDKWHLEINPLDSLFQ